MATSADGYAQGGELVEEALALRGQADEVLGLAVAGERARGVSWQVIAEQLEMTRQSAHERFAGAVKKIDEGILFPERSGGPGRLAWWACPDGIEDPRRTIEALDAWAIRHREATDPVRERPVSAGLAAGEDAGRRSVEAIAVAAEVARRLAGGDLPPGVSERQARQVLLEHKLIAFAEAMRTQAAERKAQALAAYDEAWCELVALHQDRLAEQLVDEPAGDGVALKLGERLAAVLQRGDSRSEETAGWFLWHMDAIGEIDVERGAQWVCDGDAPEGHAITQASPWLLHALATDLAKGIDALETPAGQPGRAL